MNLKENWVSNNWVFKQKVYNPQHKCCIPQTSAPFRHTKYMYIVNTLRAVEMITSWTLNNLLEWLLLFSPIENGCLYSAGMVCNFNLILFARHSNLLIWEIHWRSACIVFVCFFHMTPLGNLLLESLQRVFWLGYINNMHQNFQEDCRK